MSDRSSISDGTFLQANQSRSEGAALEMALGNPRKLKWKPSWSKWAAPCSLRVVRKVTPFPPTTNTPGAGLFPLCWRFLLVLLCPVWARRKAMGMRTHAPFILPTRLPGRDGSVARETLINTLSDVQAHRHLRYSPEVTRRRPLGSRSQRHPRCSQGVLRR